MHALENLPISNRFPRTLAASATFLPTKEEGRGGERRGEYPRDESTRCAAFGPSSTTLSTAATIPSWLIFHADFFRF